MSRPRLYSLAARPPRGFTAGPPPRPVLLGGEMVLHAPTLEEAIQPLIQASRGGALGVEREGGLSAALADRFTGLLATHGPRLRITRLGATLRHLEVPEAHADDLAELCEALIGELEEHRRLSIEREHCHLELARKEEWIQRLRRNFNQSTEEGLLRIRALEKEHSMRLAAEENLRHSEKMRVVGQLAGGVAHDFNNMLTGIRGAAELLIQTSQSADDRDLAHLIVKAADRAAALTRQLLSFTRRERLPTRPLEMHEAIHHVQALLGRSVDKRVVIQESLAAARTIVAGDAQQLESLLLNLGVNAAQAMPQGGTLRFSTVNRQVQPGEVTAAGLSPVVGEHIEITVEDSGMGISPEVLPRIFEPFFTTKAPGKGTGLGLAAVYAAVRDHRGGISVESEPGKGTRMRVLLPLAVDQKEGTVPPPSRMLRGSGTVLVIDDEPLVRSLVKAILTGAGYQVLQAEDGQEGLELYLAQASTISLVLLDMVMPRMNGAECFNHLRGLNPQIPVVLMSGYTADQDIEELTTHGASGFLRKPFGVEELSLAVQQALQASVPRGP